MYPSPHVPVSFPLRIIMGLAACTALLALFYFLHLAPSVRGLANPHVLAVPPSAQNALAQAALDEILTRGAPILGTDTGCSPDAATCDWMKKFPDSTKLTHMNLPGTHDTSTWNYSDATQQSLLRYTGPLPDASVFRCQEHSIFQMLNEGIRVFDLRYAYNPGNDTIGLHHSAALLAPTTSLSDVFFGLYSWLSKHTSETILVSLNHESGTGTPSDAHLQELVYGLFEGVGEAWWIRRNGSLPTLGEARGRLNFIQRFNYDLLPSTPAYSTRLGIHLGPDVWTDNGQAIEIVYNTATNQKAFIEDYYQILLPANSGAPAYIAAKFNATTAHLTNATRSDLNPDQLYISFASAAFIDDEVPVTPKIFALGNGTSVPGMNQLLLPWLKARKGKRFGVVMLDFYDTVPGLVEAVIGL